MTEVLRLQVMIAAGVLQSRLPKAWLPSIEIHPTTAIIIAIDLLTVCGWPVERVQNVRAPITILLHLMHALHVVE